MVEGKYPDTIEDNPNQSNIAKVENFAVGLGAPGQSEANIKIREIREKRKRERGNK